MTNTLRFSAALFLLTLSGCVTVQGAVALRPDGTPGPEECPAKALEVMRYFKLRVGDGAILELDANQLSASPITLYDGPVESVLKGGMGNLETLDRLYGRVWTSGAQLVVRYYAAHPLDGEVIPICAVARLGNGQLRKLPGSKPGMAIIEYGTASVFIVNAFR